MCLNFFENRQKDDSKKEPSNHQSKVGETAGTIKKTGQWTIDWLSSLPVQNEKWY